MTDLDERLGEAFKKLALWKPEVYILDEDGTFYVRVSDNPADDKCIATTVRERSKKQKTYIAAGWDFTADDADELLAVEGFRYFVYPNPKPNHDGSNNRTRVCTYLLILGDDVEVARAADRYADKKTATREAVIAYVNHITKGQS